MPARSKRKNGKSALDGSVKINQVIYVQREGQKAIVLGKGGQTIKIIGEMARKDMEEVFGRRVHLFLFVKVREDWAESREHYREIGLDFPKGTEQDLRKQFQASSCAAEGPSGRISAGGGVSLIYPVSPHSEVFNASSQTRAGAK